MKAMPPDTPSQLRYQHHSMVHGCRLIIFSALLWVMPLIMHADPKAQEPEPSLESLIDPEVAQAAHAAQAVVEAAQAMATYRKEQQAQKEAPIVMAQEEAP